MELNRSNMKRLAMLIAFGILLYWLLQNISSMGGVFSVVTGILSPFIFGSAVAFILNVPMRFFERHLFASPKRHYPDLVQKLRRPLALVMALVAVLAVLVIVLFLIIPQLASTLMQIADYVPQAVNNVSRWLKELGERFPEYQDFIPNFNIDWPKVSSALLEFLRSSATALVNTTFSAASSVVNTVFTFFMGMLFSIYILVQKEKLSIQFKKLAYAFLPEKKADGLIEVGQLSNRIFSKFLSGQVTEAAILGSLCFIGMMIFGFPYAGMISVLIGVLALVPIFGAFIAVATGALLILMVSPVQAFWFVVFVLVLQQIEGNLIYPRVVGSSVGLPAMWVLVAVIAGGSAFGIVGMLVCVPLCSVLYALLRKVVGRRLRGKQTPEEKFRPGTQAEVEDAAPPKARPRHRKGRLPRKNIPPTDGKGQGEQGRRP